MIYRDIMQALYTRLSLLNDIIPVVYQLKRYSPVNDGREPFIRVNLFRNKPKRLTMDDGSASQFKGILQLSITHIPSSSDWIKSEPEYIILAEQVIGHFPADLTLWHGETAVQISQMPELGPIHSTASQISLPVSVYWQSEN